MKQGSLKDIVSDNSIKLTWKQKMRMLRSAALGINYLHSLHPVIVHRDVKPSNLLVANLPCKLNEMTLFTKKYYYTTNRWTRTGT
jgi:serine/threonine protein kinase